MTSTSRSSVRSSPPARRAVAASPSQPSRASRSDPFDLYLRAVQSPEAEVTFVHRAFRAAFGRRARTLREDFCGTGANACEWARRGGRAFGIDLSDDALEWGRARNVARLPRKARARVSLLNADVRRPPPRACGVDCVLASNFSYWVFKTRPDLRAYFRTVRRSLARRGGVLVLDTYGGYESHKELRERRPLRGFTYVWEQERFDPVSSHMRAHITFTFTDGSRLRRAFSYDWRLWSIPETREILAEAGFQHSTVYLEGEDKNGEGDGVFTPAGPKGGAADATFIAYIVAQARPDP